MQAHIGRCLYGKIECPYWPCKERIVLGEVVDHLKQKHGSQEIRCKWRNGEMTHYLSCTWSVHEEEKKSCKNLYWPPMIMPDFHDGHTFLVRCFKIDFSWYTLVSVLGSKEVSEKYKVKISTSTKTSNVLSISNKGKVYSTRISKDDILNDPEGILDLSKNQILKLEKKGGGMYRMDVGYEIYRK